MISNNFLISGLIVFMLINPWLSFTQNNRPGVLKKVKREIEKSTVYDNMKKDRINNLKRQYLGLDADSINKRFEVSYALYNEYKVFKQDSAYKYLYEAAHSIDDSYHFKKNKVLIDFADISIASGMYLEGSSFLERVNVKKLDNDLVSLYYGLKGRLYDELSEYSNLEVYSIRYRDSANVYRKKALKNTEENTFFNFFLQGYNEFSNGHYEKALNTLKGAMELAYNNKDLALTNFQMGVINEERDNVKEAIKYYAYASIADIRNSTKENLAMLKLASLLFREGNLDDSFYFIKKANEDAETFGAQQRKIQINSILPLIEESFLNTIREQNEGLRKRNILISSLLVVLIGLLIIVVILTIRLKISKNQLKCINKELEVLNGEIEQKNERLEITNLELVEANRIKEQYVGFFFQRGSILFQNFHRFRNKIRIGIREENLSKIKWVERRLDISRMKREFLYEFDVAFLKLFPNYIDQVNSLLKPEEQINLKSEEKLNPELRIYALIRLGVKKTEIIAQALGYSVNSIYAYRSRMRIKYKHNPKDFDEAFLKITSLGESD